MARRFQTNRELLSNEDFKKAFEAAVRLILELEKRLIKKTDETLAGLQRQVSKMKSESENSLARSTNDSVMKLGKAFKEQADTLNFMRDWVRSVKKEITDEVLPTILTKDEVKELAKSVIPKPEAVSFDPLLEKIDELKKQIDEIKAQPKLTGRIGGGIIRLGTKFETPSGTVNGSNTTFTAFKHPLYVIVDGVTYFENNGYTLSNKTITTSVAPTGFIRSAYEY